LLTSPDYEWTEPQKVPYKSGGSDTLGVPCISADGLSLIFAANTGKPDNDLWIRERATIDVPFEKATNLGPTVNSDADDGLPTLSHDGLTLIFSSGRPGGGGGGRDLWFATRKSRAEPFGVAVTFPRPINTGGTEYGGMFTADGLTLIFAASHSGGLGGSDLWQSRRKDLRASFSEPENLGANVNSPAAEERPWVSPDGRAIVFGVHDGSDDNESGKKKRIVGSGELWFAVRADVNAPFGLRQKLGPPISGPGNDNTYGSLTGDGKLLVFSSYRTGSATTREAWFSRRVPKNKTLRPSGEGGQRPDEGSTAVATNYELDLFAATNPGCARVELPARKDNEPVTIEMYLRPRGLPSASQDDKRSWILLSHLTSTRGDGSNLFKTPSLALRGRIWQWFIRDDKTDQSYPLSIDATGGKRIHLAGVLSKTETTLYIDGRLVKKLAISKPLPVGDRTVVLGGLPFEVPNATPFDGTIDEVRISDGVRYTSDFTPAERFEPDALTWALYHCDEGTGDQLLDASGHGRHGKVIGAKWVQSQSLSSQPSLPNRRELDRLDTLTSPIYEWTTPELVATGMSAASLSGDELELVFQRGESGNNDIHIALRTALDQPFGKPKSLGPTVNSPAQENNPVISADGLSLIFASARTGPGSFGKNDLWFTTRPARSEPFGPAKPFDAPINSPGEERGGAMTADGLTLVFSSDRKPEAGSGGMDLWESRRKDLQSPFSEPVNLDSGVNSDFQERGPWLSADGLTLLFVTRPATAKNLTQTEEETGVELWLAQRPNRDAPFGPRVSLAAATKTSEGPAYAPCLNAAGRRLYFTTTAAQGPGYKLWKIDRVPKAEPSLPTAQPSPVQGAGAKALPKITTQRELAEWVIGVGGRVKLMGEKGAVVTQLAELPPQPNLQWVILVGVPQLDDTSMPQLATWPLPASVILGKTKITDAGLAALSKTPIRSLNVNYTKITDAGLSHLAVMPELHVLHACGCEITDAGLATLEGAKSLTLLDLRGTKVTANGVAKLQKTLPGCKVDWQGPAPTTDDLTLFDAPPVLPKITTQRELAEWVFSVGGKVSIAAPKGTKGNRGIEKLADLPAEFTIGTIILSTIRSIDDAHLAQMAEWPLGGQLQLANTSITDAGLAHLTRVPQLRSLYLSENRITDAGLTHLKSLTRLTTLRLTNTDITDVGLAELESLSKLTSLHVQKTKVTAAGVAKLQQALPNCVIEWDGPAKPAATGSK
jgi:hypothetical protein